jgi:uncharacterized protein DUF3551
MKHLLVILGILCGTALSGTAANAQNYPWCADYGGKMGGGSNCGFSTYAQCQAALSGNGGFCNRNTQYTGGGEGSGPSYRRHHRHHPND